MLEEIVGLFFPRKCIFCNEKINERYTCRKCLNIIEYYKERLETPDDAYYDKLICAIKYNGNLRTRMLKFKFDSVKYFARGFADILFEKMVKYDVNADLIIPVPISKKRYRERGYNQSELIVKYLSKLTKIDYNRNVLIKSKNNLKQSRLPEEQRKENVKDVYSIKNTEAIIGKNIILVDDICTTGSTVNECSKVLKNSGANRVIVLSVMYTNLRRAKL
ncbi:MAG: ComF family protein [Clostridia bacterium]|nr:ComF family protein [Clostridia bacterium]